ncbi:nucleoside deaminase [Loigolactobacillus coryniformis]|uniref:Guanine deaminase n=3 Tax=Loigolactobacillus coryniformis TaxID=1610 RepID=A0A0R1EZP6_9LACO|nr:nucleoside deaminase [Loigolactobacillus coryniformis]OEH90487.1 cytosine deaminase [Loigolactobacillus coryniformis subsp. coryniformis]ATO43192.1 tRNA-specific adenosine deaminase [Loigolactobacillus coryniformis subsp. torquens DSM 20004 = KCTC 3535]ATO54926.1 tRNA-specific adenosine deaminase [Loigolactobacillus coryniformis subsp. coryniformis KCTC 3167 = DSM 20001]KRK15016.1 guanine deaminase [Loigolactobacillus coryniformis subsp. coryniformis KCTC 3167 = DSM 20001]KRK82782.1 guanine
MNADFMKIAAAEATSNLTSKAGGPFGCVIVRAGKIIAQAHNQVLLDHDPTAHAEITCIRKATKKLGTHDLSGCVLYTSCYPCPMCLGAIIWANIKQVYYGNTAKDAAAIGFRDDYIYDFIKQGGQDQRVLALKQIARDETLPSFTAFAAQQDKELY